MKINKFKTCFTCRNFSTCRKYLYVFNVDLWQVGNLCPQYEPVEFNLKTKIFVLIKYLLEVF